jgi:hypothetical protein
MQEGKFDCMEFSGATLPAPLKQVCTMAGGSQWVNSACPAENVLGFCEVPRKDNIRQRVYCYRMPQMSDAQSIEFCRTGCNGTFMITQGNLSGSQTGTVSPLTPSVKPPATGGVGITASSTQTAGSSNQLEVDTLHIIRCSSGEAMVATFADDGYADKGAFTEDRLLHWYEAEQSGAFVELALPPVAKGRYAISVRAAKYRTYGIHQFLINGVPLGKPVDMFGNPEHDIVTPFTVNLGDASLSEGSNKFTIRLVGTNPDTIMANHGAGLDWIRLTPLNK